MIPPVAPTIDIMSYPDKKAVEQADKVRKRIEEAPFTITPGCKYRLPCGLCELTKEICRQ